MRPIKILGIAPYEGIASLMQQAAESRDDLQIVVHVGNLTAGAEIAAAQTAQEEYDVILSRRRHSGSYPPLYRFKGRGHPIVCLRHPAFYQAGRESQL